jgi:hypothetical protein
MPSKRAAKPKVEPTPESQIYDLPERLHKSTFFRDGAGHILTEGQGPFWWHPYPFDCPAIREAGEIRRDQDEEGTDELYVSAYIVPEGL